MPDQSPLAVGLIGCGAVAQLAHLPVLTSLPHAEVVALADANPERLAAAHARAPQARVFTSAEELLDQGGVQAVVIALPSALHAGCAISAFERGKHVYLEKPLAVNVAEGRRALEAWRRSECVGVIGFNYRRNPLYAAAGALLRDGAVGETLAIRSAFSTKWGGGRVDGEWRHSRATGGGALLDLASHHIDLVRHMTGREVVRVSAELQSCRTEHDTAALLLALVGGITAQLFASLASVEEDRFEVYGTTGKLLVDRYHLLTVEVEPVAARRSPIERVARLARRTRGAPYALAKTRAVAGEPSFRLAMAAFVDAVLERHAMTPDLADGFASLAVVQAAELSAATHRAVDVATMRS